jgi:hypothetical protein
MGKFNETAMTEIESVFEWYSKLKEAASCCKFGPNLEFAVKDKFITGMIAGPNLDRLERAVTMDKALQIENKQ